MLQRIEYTYLCRRACLLVLTFVLAIASSRATVRAHEYRDVERLLLQASQGREYVPPSADELGQCEQLFVRTLEGPRDEALQTEWQTVGWILRQLTIDGQELWAIYEAAPYQRGWGFYLICPERLPGLVVEAPHSFADELTRELALQLFSEGKLAACAWNTVRRDRIDVAHSSAHPFSAFTQALVQTQPQAYIMQLHGFAQEKRKSRVGATADMIISNGDGYPEPWVRKAAVLMQSHFPYGRVRLYPQEINELGATTNVQAEILRQHDSDRFIHFEMSRPLRNKLTSDVEARRLFLKNLQRAVE